MQSKQEEKMSREEIIYYVDNLIEANKKSYDKRLAPLLYEFFLRANEKFEWSREEFLEKYRNFRNNVKKIKFEKMKGKEGYFSFDQSKKGIFLNKEKIKKIKENPTDYIIYEDIINPLFHECQHAADLLIDDSGKAIKDGLYEIIDGYILNREDTMLNEYANMLSSTIIASDRPMYYNNLGINTVNDIGYYELSLPGSIMCAAFDMPEIELAKLKDKGRNAFNLYLKNNLASETMLNAFKSSLNTIHNAYENDDKENVALGIGNIIDVAVIGINGRIRQTFLENEKIEECLERIYYDIYKIETLLQKVDAQYEIEDDKEIYNWERTDTIEELLNRVKLYKRFIDNRDLFTIIEQAQIYRSIIKNNKDEDIAKELIESKIDEEYQNEEFDIEEIAKKYYIQSNEPLNDNTKLIKQVKKSFIRPTIKERFKRIIRIEQEEIPMLPSVTEALKTVQQSNLRDSVKYETPIIHTTSTEKQEQQDISKGNEESTR